MSMKRLAATFFSLALASGLAQAGHAPNASELSTSGSLTVVIGSAIVIAAPFVLVGEVLDASSAANHVTVHVRTGQGQQETIELPKEAVAKAKLQTGDRLTVKPSASGAVLAKNDTPIAFMVQPENAKLSHSHELAH
jgi:hypothetical protein